MNGVADKGAVVVLQTSQVQRATVAKERIGAVAVAVAALR